jgi:glycerol kinase
VPALTGLGAPHWDPHARGAIFGLTRGTTSAHITRAALESIAFQVDDVLQLFAIGSGVAINQLKIDGGAAANNLLAQFQADISALAVVRPTQLETTALGAAYLAGLAIGLWTFGQLAEKWQVDRVFQARLNADEMAERKHYWLKAVGRVKNWLD